MGNYYEMNLGNGVDPLARETRYYYADLGSITRLIAVNKHAALYYVLGDHLGSTVRVTDTNGDVVDSIGYTVYGETRSGGSNLPMDKGFTGQILDSSTGLYWYSSRAYNPVLCRFVQADTIVPDYNNPQSLNRYSYGYNNPVKYVDPTGHDAEDWFGDSWKAEFRDAHGGDDPQAADYAYRLVTMAIASGMGQVLSSDGSGGSEGDGGVRGDSGSSAGPFEYWTVDVGGDIVTPWLAGASGGLMTFSQGTDAGGPKGTYAHYGGGTGSPGGTLYATIGKQMSPGGLSISGLTPLYPAPFLAGVGVAAAVTIDPVVVTDPRTWRVTGGQIGVGVGTIGAMIQYELATRVFGW